MLDPVALHDGADGLADRLVLGPVRLLLLLAKVPDQFAAAAHLQATDLQGHRAQPKPGPKKRNGDILYRAKRTGDILVHCKKRLTIFPSLKPGCH